MSDNIPSAVFLHSTFRSGSTWFWNRFRQSAEVVAYYEPFNEVLDTLTARGIARHRPDSWNSGHPALNSPYYAEYAPLLRHIGGVTQFEPRFSYECYFDADENEGMRRYIATLCEAAWQSNKLPVLGFCRSMVRVPWFRQHCDGVHIATWRNPWDQWISYHDQNQRNGSTYFEFRSFLIGCIGRCHRDYAGFFADLHLPLLQDYGNQTAEEFLSPFFLASDVDRRFRVFLRLFMLDMLTVLQHADVVVDLDRMSAEPGYRDSITERLRSLSGLPDLSFDDCALPRHGYQPDANYVALMEEALAFLDRYLTDHPRDAGLARAIAELKERMGECLRRMVVGATALQNSADESLNGGGPDNDKESGGIDRYMLSHFLAAILRTQRSGGDVQQGLAYLQAVFGSDYDAERAHLAWMAGLIEILNVPDHQQEVSIAGSLRQALLVEDSLSPR